MATASFTGEYPLRIDGKGRMSIPAAFRKVLDQGHPDRDAGELASFQLLYGRHANPCLRGYSMAGFAALGERIAAMPERNRDEARAKEFTRRTILSASQPIEVDRDGRIVLPAARRADLGLTEGDLMVTGTGVCFEIWSASAYQATVGAEIDAFFDEMGEGFDPMTLIGAAGV